MFRPTTAFLLLHSFLDGANFQKDYKAPHAYRGTPPRKHKGRPPRRLFKGHRP